jgi:pentatricopeptide repeat protein
MEAEEVFESLLKEERSPFKPDQKMFHMMIYLYKKAGNYEKAHKLLSERAKRGIPRTTVTFNSVISFETDYREVSNIYDQVALLFLKLRKCTAQLRGAHIKNKSMDNRIQSCKMKYPKE